MKKVFLTLAVALMTVSNVSLSAQDVVPYYELDQLPKLIDIMPAPPSFDSPEFANDVVRYGWGKTQRQNEERLQQAIADAEWNDHVKVFSVWKEAFGLEINAIDTPEIWKLLETALATTDPMRKETKQFYGRQRPFERFNDTMPSHEEDELRGEGSYPSGHSLRGWGISLLLAQIAPERAAEIFKRGWDYCTSRVILGAHWQSDVDASRTAASIGFCALQGNEAFIAQMKKAQAEYKAKTSQAVGVRTATIVEHPANHAYSLNGTVANGARRGIIIQNGQKIQVM